MSRQESADDRERARFVADLASGLERSGVTGKARLLAALSGGADSMALLRGLFEIAGKPGSSIEIEAAHFNHQLRGDDSNADERFCRETCGGLGVPLHVGRADVSTHAASSGQSIEAAARDLRYRFLADTVAAGRFDAVVTGHTLDDQAETVLLSVSRGAGLRGLSGMSYASQRDDLNAEGKPLRVLRPMLAMRRSDTERFCQITGITPVQDESNLDPTYARNRVRNSVLPELSKINERVIESLGRLAAVTSADIEFIDELADDALDQATMDDSGAISRETLTGMAPALRIHVIAAAYRKAVGSARDLDMASLVSAVDAVRQLASGSIDLPNRARLVVEHDRVRFLVGEDDPACPYPERVSESSLQLLKSIQFQGGGSLTAQIVSPAPGPKSLSRWQAIVNAAAVSGRGFSIRPRRDGDRFQPLGMDQQVKLQDFFVNQHVPARWRGRVPLVLTERGICWVVGERIAEWARVPEGASEAVLLEYAVRS